jgi:hypothetical protein
MLACRRGIRISVRHLRAPPEDDVSGTTRVSAWLELWKVLFGSGDWRSVHVRARRRDRLGRQVTDVEWHSDGATWQESYRAEPAKMQKPGIPDGGA